MEIDELETLSDLKKYLKAQDKRIQALETQQDKQEKKIASLFDD